MKKYRYEEMLPREFLDAVAHCPVFIVPMGLLEWHADHLPLGQDGLKAHGICLRLAEKLDGGIVLPPFYLGRPGFSTYTGTLTFSEGLMQQALYELCVQLEKVGAKVIVLMVGHYGPAQEECVERFRKIYTAERPHIRLIAHKESKGVLVDGEEPSDHAGLWETSMFMRMYPELTHMELLEDPPFPQKRYGNAPYDYYRESETWIWPNDAPAANAALGEKAVDAIAEQLKSEVLEALHDVS